MLLGENIRVQIGDAAILTDVSLCIRPGEVLAVLGPNGAGKSTLLRVLSGEIEPTEGRVTLNGYPVTRSTRAEQARRRAVVSQSAHLPFPFTAVEVVLMGRIPHQRRGIETGEDVSIAADALRLNDAGRFAQRSYGDLSGGERQRTDMARALAQIWEEADQHRFLLLDEPTASLDLKHQHAALHLARSYADDGVGVLLILHDLNLAAAYADRILLLKEGRTHAEGSPEDVLTPEIIRGVYDVHALVLEHPFLGVPLIVVGGGAPTEGLSNSSESIDHNIQPVPAINGVHS